MNNTELSFFASANSGRGFINYYGEIFDGLKKHYIIKGGPGTGKSSLMKAVAKAAEAKGMTVEKFFCSSDPDSLDGIIVKEISTGITDGTAPHASDPHYPGVIDEIIDLGMFWNKNVLENSKDQIIESVNNKTRLYKNAYSYLNAAISIDKIIQREYTESSQENIAELAKSYTKAIGYHHGKQNIRLTDAITMKGYHYFTPYRKHSDIIYNIKDSYGAGHMFLNKVKSILYGNEMTVSYDPLDTEKVNMIYLPYQKILFTLNGDQGEEIKLDEFISKPIDNKASIQKTELLKHAYSLLSEIKEQHFLLENIYISAMDFSRKEEYQERLMKEIFS